MTEEPQYIEEIHDEPDSWHRHTADEGAPQSEHAAKVNVVFLAGVLLFTIVFVAVLVVLVQTFFAATQSRLRAEKTETDEAWKLFDAELQPQLRDLASYGIADAQAGTAHIPIEQAMQRIVERYTQ